MKKNILFFLTIILLAACNSQQKKQSTSVGMKGFYTYYNTLFNSKEALEFEINERKKSHQDNFFAPYITLLTTEEQTLGSDVDGANSMFSDDENGSMMGNSGPLAPGNNQNATTSSLQISEAKALKAITKFSVMKSGVEKNKKLFDAHILLAQSRLLMNKPLEALEALNFLFNHMNKDKDLPLAKIYQAEAYAKMKDFHKAEELFAEVKSDSKLKKSKARLLSVYYSEMLLKAGKKEAAVNELEEAFSLNKNRILRSRIAFLRGQILSNIGKPEEARESFTTAYKYANNFEFEVKSQIEIAKTFNGGDDDYGGAKKYIENISKKGTYTSRKNEFYYALGLMAKKAGKNDEALDYFKKSVEGQASDPQIRGLAFFEIGQDHFAKNDYIATGAYYDSALAVMSYAPEKRRLTSLSENIKKITRNYYLIKKNDSVLALTKMSEPDRVAFFSKHIEELKIKEEKEAIAKRKEERSKGFDNGDYNANSIFAGNNENGFQDLGSGNTKGGFYFGNNNTVSKGNSEFKQIWGDRALADNWRYSSRMSSIEDVKNEAIGVESVQNPRRFESDFYIEKIPTDQQTILALKKDRDTASLGLGRMYDNFFSKTELATKTLYDLVDNQPEEDIKLQALYQIFIMNYQKNPQSAERAKNLILQEFPYTSYAEFVKNPKSTSFSASAPEVEKLYTDAFALYSTEKYDESGKIINEALQKYPKDALVPKFSLLQAFNTGKTAGKEIMILQLEQIALNYAKTMEGAKAKEMLKYLKSDLSMEMTDQSGAKIPQNVATKPTNAPEKQGLPNPNEFSEDDDEVDRIQKEQAELLRKRDREAAEKRKKEAESQQQKSNPATPVKKDN